jgi:hypothetical protein
MSVGKKALLGVLCVLGPVIGFVFFRFLVEHPPPDFLPLYFGGKLAATGQIAHLYDQPAYQPLKEQFQREGGCLNLFDAHYFIRPAFQAYFYALFAWLPYPAASMLAVLINFALLGLIIWKMPIWFQVDIQLRLAVRLCLGVFFPFLWCMSVGQDTLLLTLIVAYALHLESTGKQGWAGIVLGLGLYKPHLLWALPLALAAARRWKMASAFLAVAALLAAVSLASVGIGGVRQWVELVRSPSTDILAVDMGNIRALYLHWGPVAAGFALAITATCFAVILRRGRFSEKCSAAILTALLLSPHTYWQDYSLWAVVSMVPVHRAAMFCLLAPWTLIYGRLDELPLTLVSLAYLAFLAAKPRREKLHHKQAAAPAAPGLRDVRLA